MNCKKKKRGWGGQNIKVIDIFLQIITTSTQKIR